MARAPLRQLCYGLFAGLLVFSLINVLAAHLMSDCGLPALLGWAACNDDIVRAGWPLKFYEEGGIAFHSFYSSYVLVEDMVIGILGSSVLAIATFLHRRSKAA